MCTRHVFLATIKKLVVENSWEADFYKRGSIVLYCPNGTGHTPIEAVRKFGENGGCCATLVSDLTPRSLALIKGASCNTYFENATYQYEKAFRLTRIGLLNSCGLRERFLIPLSRF